MGKTPKILKPKAARHNANLDAFEEFRSKYRHKIRCLLSKELVQSKNPLRLSHTELEELLDFGKRSRGEKGLPRPQNQWVLYRKYKRLEVDITRFGQITKIVACQWHTETNSVKQFFEFLAEISKRAHKLAFPEYRFRPGQNFSKKKKDIKMSEPDHDLGVNNLGFNNNTIGHSIQQLPITDTISESPQFSGEMQLQTLDWSHNQLFAYFNPELFAGLNTTFATLNLQQPQELSSPAPKIDNVDVLPLPQSQELLLPVPKIDNIDILSSQTTNEQIVVPSMPEINHSRSVQSIIELQKQIFLLSSQQNSLSNLTNFQTYQEY
ncbi:6974_t:CDS:1 [Ambispora gerdemannii]|uniref:6974_t:CDS:1 n=1 Tax=Ambispora gerdemannii TaxID=144530 RepID=A0A9N8V1F9_9GLOM|nr:6974_t:CDS:1 [Ambispora gerdemannii]